MVSGKKSVHKRKMFVLLTANAASERNKMRFSTKIVEGVPIFVPTSRIKLVEDAIKGDFISADGRKSTLSRLHDVFKYALEMKQKRYPVANNGSFGIQGGYTEQTGWGFQGQFTLSWAKQEEEEEEENAYNPFDKREDLFKPPTTIYAPTPMPLPRVNGKRTTILTDTHKQPTTVYAPTPMPLPRANKRETTTLIDFAEKIKTIYMPTPPPIFKPERNGGGVTISGGYSQESGWGVQGGVSHDWGKGSVKAQGGWSQKGGGKVTATVTIRFAKACEDTTDDDDVRDLYVTEIITPEYVMYLPTYTEGKFDNLVEQIRRDEVEISTN